MGLAAACWSLLEWGPRRAQAWGPMAHVLGPSTCSWGCYLAGGYMEAVESQSDFLFYHFSSLKCKLKPQMKYLKFKLTPMKVV